MCDDLCRKLETIFHNSIKGRQIIRDAEFLEEIWYTNKNIINHFDLSYSLLHVFQTTLS